MTEARSRGAERCNADRTPDRGAAGIRTLGIGLWCGLAAVAPLAGEGACAPAGSTLRFGFYAHFEPVSSSADPDPASPAFHEHRGYEADLLTALEAMAGANLTFDRRGIAAWDGIWLLPAGPEYDLVGGGITILESRTRGAAGQTVVAFTAGHIEFRQSLLVRAADARRLARHEDLTDADRVGVLAGTTGEARLLELTGIADASGCWPPAREWKRTRRRWSPMAAPGTSSPPPAQRRASKGAGRCARSRRPCRRWSTLPTKQR